jgi:hypothetical protein
MRGRIGREITQRSQRARPAGNLVKRNFAVTKMDEIWVADMEMIPRSGPHS